MSTNVIWAFVLGTILLLGIGTAFVLAIVWGQRKRIDLQEIMFREVSEREAKYRNLFGNSLVGMVRWSLREARVEEANTALLTMCGVNSVEEILSAIALVNREDGHLLRQELEVRGRIDQREVLVERKDDQRLCVSVSCKLDRETGVVEGVVIDITARKNAEEALQKSNEELERRVKDRTTELRLTNEELKFELAERKRIQLELKRLNEELERRISERALQLEQAYEELRTQGARYRSLVENMNEIYYVVSAEGKFLYASPNLFSQTGYTHEELLTTTYLRIVDDLHRRRVVDFYADAIKSRVLDTSIEFPVHRKHGPAVWVEQATRIVRGADGEVVELRHVVRDIHQRKLAEEALRRAEQNFRSIVENALEGIYQSTPKGVYLSVNPAFARIFGYSSPAEMIRSVVSIRDQIYVHPEDRDRYMQLLQGQEKVQGFEYEAYRRDGNKIWVIGNARGVRDEEGKLLYYEGTVEDITERKIFEEALKDLTKRVIEAQESERRRVSRELHDGVSQLLSSVKFRLHAAEERLKTRGRNLWKEVVGIRDPLEQAIQEVKSISKNLRPSVLDDLGLLAAIRSTCKDFQARTQIEVNLHAQEIPCGLPTDIELSLYRIIQEGLNNVEKHSGATLVQLLLGQTDSILMATLKDNGKGFDPKRVKKNGQKFSGLGLLGIRERVASMGGSVEVLSQPNVGTEINVRIPVHGALGS